MGRIAKSSAGDFSEPEFPTAAIHSTEGSHQPRLSSISRVVPIADASAARTGAAMSAGSQPIADAPCETNERSGAGNTSSGKGCHIGGASEPGPVYLSC